VVDCTRAVVMTGIVVVHESGVITKDFFVVRNGV
jgi:hypothetical protein